ncbi:50S ribosomal protein L16 [candidate division WOR-1 bacterium RIFOXYA12_FULL_43_27]|uniref:50S ribosomal protein L16 n=1 Tax=candidate division WOR-1 bacterium RIFOXYC2_FULL_46_14 TaxID=1802587 RepID=A0A1F4U6K6_UNCSA|nr:MAG: 50S ribosomal protein L16 [candidate division WOR-1 bacterium RIFOXYA12_FULL_43_27]OGC20943.1 MAG: 50S ribosomal protein L16 [candidate division WOR-1 bacterium RIFOXYB2_FULL_46_45]OGC32297.1 MAG: 50S ribosomal protein L16 [candidate division WOR-1 bacterium RIFOXYA2_FULL_46_56]OGC40499.1 MAG: 50S ribosomal protein L16 [candidate division WOR-1 bacterium RIFOXYC2_FULL_46_14]
MTPKKTKFRKSQRRRLRGKASRGNTLVFGEFGLQILEIGYLKTNQIEAGRKALTHCMKRGGKVWVRGCADKPVTARAAETRMGGGKGAPIGYALPVKPGHILYEVTGVTYEAAVEAFRLAAFKLPFAVRVVRK